MPSSELDRVNAMWRGMLPTKENPTVEEMRDSFDQLVANFPIPDDVRADPVDAGGVPALWVSIVGRPSQRTIFYLHGGGYVIGSADGYRS